MATTLDNINLPSNPDLGAAEVGKDFLLFVLRQFITELAAEIAVIYAELAGDLP